MSDIVIIGSLVPDLIRGQTTSSTDANFSVTNSRPTTTKPAASTTRTVIPLGDGTLAPFKKSGVTLKVRPFGGDDDNDKIFVKVQGWNKVKGTTGATTILYVPTTVCIVEATLSAALPGVATMPVVATEYFADILSLTSGIAVLHQGTADVDIAWLECDVSSFEWVEVLYAKSTGANRCNCVWGW